MNKKYTYRSMGLRLDSGGVPSTINRDTRSVEVIAATEEPVEVYDWERWEVVKEVLPMAGCELPETRQVPLLDSHQRYSTASVIGSARELRVEGAQLCCRSYFAEAPEAEGPFAKVRDGHLTDFSIGYRVFESVWVPDGESAVVHGRTYNGPVKIAKRWRPKELSVCPIGADELAKARSEAGEHPPAAGGHDNQAREHSPAPQKKETVMDPKLRAFLERRGLSKDASEEEAWKFFERMDAPPAIRTKPGWKANAPSVPGLPRSPPCASVLPAAICRLISSKAAKALTRLAS